MKQDTRRSRLPFDSYRSRYLLLALLLTCFLVVIAWVGYSLVQQISQSHIEKITQRGQVSAIVSSLLSHLNHVHKILQDIVIEPEPTLRSRLDDEFNVLQRSLRQLDATDWSRQNSDAAGEAVALLEDYDALAASSEYLMSIRFDDSRWFPANSIMEERLLPNFVNSLTTLDEISRLLLDEYPLDVVAEQINHIQGLRMGWVQMTAELRLYIANRFGVFSTDTAAAMENRRQNVDLFADKSRQHLHALAGYANEGHLGFYGDDRMPGLVQAFTTWIEAKDDLVDSLADSMWRKDLAQLRQVILPVLDRMQLRLGRLQQGMDSQSASEITYLTETAVRLAILIVLITGGVLVVTLVGYFSFSRLLLTPIEETTRALMQEASGEPISLGRMKLLRETRDLADAFHRMQDQVRSRQDRLDHLAHHDLLTQLPNRVYFNKHLQRAIENAVQHDRQVALLFLDLDRFKQINDSLGHGMGDLLLREVASRLMDVTGLYAATVSRFGGDEFAIIIDEVDDLAVVEELATRVLEAFIEPFEIGPHELFISTSIGIGMAPNDLRYAHDLLRAADTAMYAAKQQGRNQYKFFSQEMSQRNAQQLSLENELRRALEKGEFELHYQPVVSVGSGELAGFEALLRWNHPQRGLLTPDSFLAVLEDSGLIKPVTLWLTDELGRMISRLPGGGEQALGVSMNLTARLLQDHQFAQALYQRVTSGQLAADRLVIELTEDALAGYFEKADEFLQQLKQLGVRVALDDFGTGQSSLEHLRHFHFDYVKIDRSFVQDITTDPGDASLVDAIIQLGHSFDMQVVAEGVETEAQYSFISECGCDYLQGFLISKAVPEAIAIELAERGRLVPAGQRLA